MKLIEASCDLGNTLCQGYALSVLANIIKEYPDYERSIGQAQANEFHLTIGANFPDLTYSCLLVLRSSDEALGSPSTPAADMPRVN